MRELFSLTPDVSHLNHGSFGTVPIRVQQAQQRLRDDIELDPVRFFAHDLPDRVASARAALVAFLGADPDGCAFVANATSGTAVVLNTLGLRPGDEVVITDHRYEAVGLALHRQMRERGIVVTTVPIDLDATDEEIVAALVAAVQPGRTRLIIIDHVASATAKLFPVAKIAAALRGSGVPLHVDAAHAPGMLDLPVAPLGADFWVGNLHKWAYAPRGTALLQVSPTWRERVAPVVVSWGDAQGYPENVEQQGTRDLTCWLAAPEGAALLTELGFASCREHNARLAESGQALIADALGVPIRPEPGPDVSMRVIPLPSGTVTDDASADALRRRISVELRTQVNVHAWRGAGLLRICAQLYNTIDEYQRLAVGLRRLLG